MFRTLTRLLGATILMIVGAFGISELKADRGGCRPVPPRCVCPLVFAPVVCDRGCTYSNACFAECAGATGCVPAS